MRHFRRTVLAALAVALCAAPAAAAHGPRPHASPVVAPARGGLLGEMWAQALSLPVPENPFAGNGNPCLSLGGNVLQAIVGPEQTVTCTAKQGTVLFTGWGTECSDVEAPPFYGVDEAAQRACALASDQNVEALRITVDNGRPVDVYAPRFELFSPQRTVQMPADNLFGIPPQRVTFTVHAWAAIVRKLRPGRHTIASEVMTTDFTATFTHIVNIVAGAHSNDEEDHHH
jgi:hypothetical protein